MHQAILDIEAGLYDVLAMHESSRLARNEQLANHILDRLDACGAAFINSLIDVDYTTPEGSPPLQHRGGPERLQQP